MNKIFEIIKEERVKQDEKWGNSQFFKYDNYRAVAVLGEEFGEVARAVLENDEENLVDELVQVAAVCVKWIEMIGERKLYE